MRIYKYAVPLGLIAVLAACGGGGENSDGDYTGGDGAAMVNSAASFKAAMEAAYESASPEMRATASEKGTLPCDLPKIADARAARSVDAKSETFNTDAKPEEAAAFYRIAAESQDGSASFSGPPGMAEIAITTNSGSKCRVVAQAQLSGDTNILVISEN